jgi:2-polyprenyl-6-methoxyphenol hydroxylase-like FAD-dependent oxidoreductase
VPHVFDIAILGATPAGLAAAHHLVAKRFDVVVVDTPPQSTECPLADWLPRGFFRLAGLPKGLARNCKATEFSRVAYHNVTLDRQVDYRARTAAGHFARTSALTRSFRAAAAKAGAKLRTTRTSPAIRLEEDLVQLVGSTQVRARLLLITHSRPNDVLSELALPLRTVPGSSLVAAGLDVPLRGRKGLGKDVAGALHVVELPERSELGAFFLTGNVLHLRVISNSPAAGTRAAELSAMVNGLQQAGVLPADLPLGRAKGAVWRPPAGVALELETHVAKRCLLAGTAGGFAESITGQSLWSSVCSALIAADVAANALKSDEPQGVLMGYKTLWRRSLADRLRPPNTSLQMLLPLLFVNQRIVSKFTRALLYGENI